MAFPYGNGPTGPHGGHVPIRVARQLAEQRDQLGAQLERERRRRARLESELEAAVERMDLLERHAERANRRLAHASQRAAERSEAVQRQTGHQGEASERIEALERRAASAEQEAARLREELEHARQAAAHHDDEAEPAPEAPAETAQEAPADEDGLVDQLRRRVASLTNDLERVEQRARRTADQSRQAERARLLGDLGEVLDSVERALEVEATPGPWRQGLEAIREQLVRFIRAQDAELTGRPGEPVDPRLHEAVGVVASPDHERGHIVHVQRHGITLADGTVARAAQVIVAG